MVTNWGRCHGYSRNGLLRLRDRPCLFKVPCLLFELNCVSRNHAPFSVWCALSFHFPSLSVCSIGAEKCDALEEFLNIQGNNSKHLEILWKPNPIHQHQWRENAMIPCASQIRICEQQVVLSLCRAGKSAQKHSSTRSGCRRHSIGFAQEWKFFLWFAPQPRSMVISKRGFPQRQQAMQNRNFFCGFPARESTLELPFLLGSSFAATWIPDW